MSRDIALPTFGVVTERDGLVLAWPEPHEFDAMTDLRNRDAVRKWFLDRRPLDVAANRHWLAEGIRRGEEGLLAIRLAATGDLLGTIGWTDYCPDRRTACFGRLMVDADKAAALRDQGDWQGGSIALAAALILRDYSFTSMGLEDLTTWYFCANRHAARINTAVGMAIRGEGLRLGPDGTPIPTVELAITRQEWQAMVFPA